MNHTGITAGCGSCHNGTMALGKPATHVATTAACETCHKSTAFTGATFNHALSARYPLSNELRINPRLRLGYQVSDTTDLREVTILPSILINYYWTRDLSLELEIGAKWTERQQAGATQTESDLFFTAGFRYDFYPDRQKPCGLVTTCR